MAMMQDARGEVEAWAQPSASATRLSINELQRRLHHAWALDLPLDTVKAAKQELAARLTVPPREGDD